MSRILCPIVMFVLMTAGSVQSEDGCPIPPYMLPEGAPIFLSEQQENYFGDAFAEQIQNEFLVIEDKLAENIRKIGQRLLDQAPPSNLNFQFFLVEYPELNAFSLPGGRIYIPRKLVAACRNEDELAGVLAHEIGHNIARHPAISFSRLLNKVLNVTSLGDRKDVVDKYNQLLDNAARNRKVVIAANRYDEDEEITADQISIYLLSKAGYSPEAFIKLWDRTMELEGKTGGFLGDFFRTTRPEQKRLREMLHEAENLPDACRGPKSSTTAEEFKTWKTAVMEYSGIGHRESLPITESKQPLRPPLRGNIRHMRFSRDGKFLLAQDSSSIFVLSHNPFRVLFRIDARKANPAQFAPDSKSIVFSTSSLRIEKWNIAGQKRTSVQEMAMTFDCLRERLSPDAKHLACLDQDFRLTLLNVSDGTKVFQKDYTSFSELISLLSSLTCQLEYSPDGRYFLGAGLGGDECIAYDFLENSRVKLPGDIKKRLDKSFGFISGNRIVGIKGTKGDNAAIMSFPSGEVLQTMPVGYSRISPTTSDSFLILEPIKEFPVGIMDLTEKKLVMGVNQSAIDIYGRSFASEHADGVICLFHIGKEEALAKAKLPESPLPQPVAASISADLNWLAVSENSRGAIWNLRTGKRTFLARSYQSAKFAPDNTLIVDFPQLGEEQRMIVRINPAGPSIVSSAIIEENRSINHEGLYLTERKEPNNRKDKPKTLLSVTSALTGRELWNRNYPKDFPWMNFNSDENKAIFLWEASTDFVKKESKSNLALKEKIKSKREREGDYYIQILQASTGKVLHTVYIETGRGSFRLLWAELAGDYMVLSDNQNRLLVYSISSGERLGQIFGVNGSLSPTTPLLAAENKPGVLTIYSLPSMEKIEKLMFSRSLVYVKFSSDGKRLFALTSDQMTYLFNTEILSAGKPKEVQTMAGEH